MKKWERPRLSILVQMKPAESLIFLGDCESGSGSNAYINDTGCYALDCTTACSA